MILAAGGSRRLGQPKQLVPWKGTNLLNHTIREAQKVEHSDIMVVLGEPDLDLVSSLDAGIRYSFNPDWNLGMGSSIAHGIKQLDKDKYQGVILSVCDQPFISTDNFSNLISKFEQQKKGIIVSNYGDTITGPPSLFASKYFERLSKLIGDVGAKGIVREHKDDVTYVCFASGQIDIDEPKDLDRIQDYKD